MKGLLYSVQEFIANKHDWNANLFWGFHVKDQFLAKTIRKIKGLIRYYSLVWLQEL